MEPIIETVDLSCVYSIGTPFEHKALDQVNFTAYPGEYIGIIGHTGSGKSTLIQHLNGLLKPTSGQVRLRGKDIWADRKKITAGAFPRGSGVPVSGIPALRGDGLQRYFFRPPEHGAERGGDRPAGAPVRPFVGLTDEQLELSPFELSGGQKRRVAIAGVIAMEPEVLILDEPTAGLDPVGREEILSNIRAYHDAKNATIILVSHSMEEVAQTVDRVVVINDGTIPLMGTPQEVFSHEKELTAMGLGVPKVTQVCEKLRDMGLPIKDGIYTLEEAASELLKLVGKGGAVC